MIGWWINADNVTRFVVATSQPIHPSVQELLRRIRSHSPRLSTFWHAVFRVKVPIHQQVDVVALRVHVIHRLQNYAPGAWSLYGQVHISRSLEPSDASCHTILFELQGPAEPKGPLYPSVAEAPALEPALLLPSYTQLDCLGVWNVPLAGNL